MGGGQGKGGEERGGGNGEKCVIQLKEKAISFIKHNFFPKK